LNAVRTASKQNGEGDLSLDTDMMTPHQNIKVEGTELTFDDFQRLLDLPPEKRKSKSGVLNR